MDFLKLEWNHLGPSRVTIVVFFVGMLILGWAVGDVFGFYAILFAEVLLVAAYLLVRYMIASGLSGKEVFIFMVSSGYGYPYTLSSSKALQGNEATAESSAVGLDIGKLGYVATILCEFLQSIRPDAVRGGCSMWSGGEYGLSVRTHGRLHDCLVANHFVQRGEVLVSTAVVVRIYESSQGCTVLNTGCIDTGVLAPCWPAMTAVDAVPSVREVDNLPTASVDELMVCAAELEMCLEDVIQRGGRAR